MQSAFLKKILPMCLILTHYSCGYFWPEHFFFFPFFPLLKRTNSAKTEFTVISIFSRLLITEGKESLAILSRTLSLSHICMCFPSRVENRKWIYTSNMPAYFVHIDHLNFLFWSEILNILFKGKSNIFLKFSSCPVFALLWCRSLALNFDIQRVLLL